MGNKIKSTFLIFYLIFLSSIFCEQENKDSINDDKFNWPEPGAEPSAEVWYPSYPTPPPGPTDEQCENAIYNQCNRPTTFNDNQLNTVLGYLNKTFTTMAAIPPDTTLAPLCPAITVRRDWKCLTTAQKKKFISIWKQLYDTGEIARLTDLYARYQAAWTQTAEFLPSCRWFGYELDRLIANIDPTAGPMPYLCPWTAGIRPERSVIWNTFGRSGNYAGGYCAKGGIYDKWDLIPCMKYEWACSGAIYPWATCELDSNVIQFGQSYSLFYFAWLGIHYQPLVNSGGFAGQLSYTEAPYNLLYFMFTLCECEVRGIKWQLSNQANLTPLTYNDLIVRYDNTSGAITTPSIQTDTLTGAPNVTIRQLFWLGYGKMCTIPDSLITPIIRVVRGNPDPLPTAFKKMHPYLLGKHFPYMLYGNSSAFLHNCEEIGDCNRGCRQITKPTFLQETEAGRRVLQLHERYGGQLLELAQQHAYEVWYDLNKYGYCSPYA